MESHNRLKLLREQNHKLHFIEGRYAHCQERAKDRYGFDLTYDDWERINLIAMKETDDCKFVCTGDTSETGLYIIKFAGQQFFVCYSESAYLTMTFLPRHDARFVAALHGAAPKAVTGVDEVYRKAKRAVADGLDDMVVSGHGELRLASVPAPLAVREASPNNVFADALKDFRPVAARPVLTAVPKAPALAPVVQTIVEPETVAVPALFAQLEARFAAYEAQLAEAEEVDGARIRDLEAQLADLRCSEEGRASARQYIGMNRDFAQNTYHRFSDGALNEASAISIANMMLAQQAANDEDPTPAANEVAEAPTAALEASAGESGDNGVLVMRGSRQFYRMDGQTQSLVDWAAKAKIGYHVLYQRIKSGMSLREAIAMPVRGVGQRPAA